MGRNYFKAIASKYTKIDSKIILFDKTTFEDGIGQTTNQ